MVNAEIKTANHCVGPSGAVISSGTATVDVEVVDMETDQESTDEHNNASVNLDTSELRELEGLETEGEIDQDTLDLKLLDKSQDDVSIKPLYKIQTPLKGLKEDKIIIIMVTIIGRTTNTNKGTLNRRKKMVQCHACNKNTWKYIRIKNLLSCVQFRTILYFLYFSLIYVYMFTTFVFIHILHKNYKQESQKNLQLHSF